MKSHSFVLSLAVLFLFLPGCSSRLEEKIESDLLEPIYNELVEASKNAQASSDAIRNETKDWDTEKENLRNAGEISQTLQESPDKELKSMNFTDHLLAEDEVISALTNQLNEISESLEEEAIDYEQFDTHLQKIDEILAVLSSVTAVSRRKNERLAPFIESSQNHGDSLIAAAEDDLKEIDSIIGKFRNITDTDSDQIQEYLDRSEQLRKTARDNFEENRKLLKTKSNSLIQDQTVLNQHSGEFSRIQCDSEDLQKKLETKKDEIESENIRNHLSGFFKTVKEVKLDEASRYETADDGSETFTGGYTITPWSDCKFSDLVDYCKIAKKKIQIEYIPFTNTFKIGTCSPPECTIADDGSWVYNFDWSLKAAGNESQNLMTVTLSETGISTEQKECRFGTLNPDETISILNNLRLGELKFSIIDLEDKVPDSEKKNLKKTAKSEVTFLYPTLLKEDKFEADNSAISVEEKLKDFNITSELKLAPNVEIRIEYMRQSPFLKVDYEDGNIMLSRIDTGFYNEQQEHKAIFATRPSEKNIDDRIIQSMTFINNFPAPQYVEQTFFTFSGIPEQVQAQIIGLEAEIQFLSNQIIPTTDEISSDPKIAQLIFRKNQMIVKGNRSIKSKITKKRTQISRLQKSVNTYLKKHLQRAHRYFAANYFVHYKIYLKNKETEDEFLLVDASSGNPGEETWESAGSNDTNDFKIGKEEIEDNEEDNNKQENGDNGI